MVFADMLLYVKLVMLLAKHFMDSKLLGSILNSHAGDCRQSVWRRPPVGNRRLLLWHSLATEQISTLTVVVNVLVAFCLCGLDWNVDCSPQSQSGTPDRTHRSLAAAESGY